MVWVKKGNSGRLILAAAPRDKALRMPEEDLSIGISNLEELLRRLDKHAQEHPELNAPTPEPSGNAKDTQLNGPPPLQVKCPKCGDAIVVDRSTPGEAVRCRKCAEAGNAPDNPVKAPDQAAKPPVKAHQEEVARPPEAKPEDKPAQVIQEEVPQPPVPRQENKSPKRINIPRIKKIILSGLCVLALGAVYHFFFRSGEYKHWRAQLLIYKLDGDSSESARGELLKMGAEAVPRLARALGNNDPAIRTKAAAVLQEMGPTAKGAVPALIKALGAEDGPTRYAAAKAIGGIGPDAEAAVPGLTKLLEGKLTGPRDAALRALGDIGKGAKPAVPVLVGLLKGTTDSYLIEAAANCLGYIGPDAKEAGPVLMGLLKDTSPMVVEEPDIMMRKRSIASDRRPKVHLAAIKALNSMGFYSAESIGLLMKLRNSKDVLIRAVAGRMRSDLGESVKEFALRTMKISAALDYPAIWAVMSNRMKSTFAGYEMYKQMRAEMDSRSIGRAGGAAIAADIGAAFVGPENGRLKAKVVWKNPVKTCLFYYYIVQEGGVWKLDKETFAGCSLK